MAVSNIIEFGFNVAELTEEKQQVLAIFSDLYEKINNYPKVNPINVSGVGELKSVIQQQTLILEEIRGGFDKYNKVIEANIVNQQKAAQVVKENISGNTNHKKAVDEVSLAVKEYEKIANGIAVVQAKNNVLSSNAAENLAIEKEQLKQRNNELTQSVKLLVAESGSVNEAKAAVAALKTQRDGLNLSTQEGRDRQKELNKQINEYDEFIRKNVSTLEQQKINVGNYAGSLKGAFNGLKINLQEVREQLATLTPNDANFAKVAQEEQLLTQLTENLSKTFGSTKQELRAFSEAAKQMGLQFGMADERFQSFIAEVGEQKDKLSDIQSTINFQGSDTKYLDGIVGAVNGLAGAYGAAQAASNLLTDGDEASAKEMAKMQNVLVLVTSLQALMNSLQTEGGAIQLALEAKTKLLNAAELVTAGIKKMLVVDTTAQAVATGEQAIAAEAAAVAEGELAVAEGAVAATSGVATEALVVQTAATGAAEVATVSLEAAFVATGIGALVIALAAGVAWLASKTYEWAKADELAEGRQAKVAEAVKNTNEAINSQVAFIGELNKLNRIGLEDELANTDKAGASQEKLFALKKKIAEFDKKASIDAISRYEAESGKDVNLKTLNEFSRKVNDANEKLSSLNRLQELYKQNHKGKENDTYKENIDNATKERDGVKSVFDSISKLYTDRHVSEQNINQISVEETKFTADEKIKLTLETAKIEAGTIIEKNSLILNNERSTMAQRLAAMRSTAAENKAIAKAELDAVKSNPANKNPDGSDTAELKIAKKNYNATIFKIDAEAKAERQKLIESYNQRELAAQLAIDTALLNAQKKLSENIISDNKNSLDVRMSALRSSIDDEKSIIEKDTAFKLQQAKVTGKTETEIQAIRTESATRLQDLTETTAKRIYDITISWGEKTQKDLADLNKNQSGTKTTDEYNKALSELNNSLLKRTTSYEGYLLARKQLDDKYLTDKDSADVADDQAELARLREHEKEIQDLKRSAAIELQTAKDNEDDDEISKAQKKADALAEVEKNNLKAIADAEKKAAEDRKKLEEDSAKKVLEQRKLLHDKIKELENASYGLAKQLVDDSFDNEKNKLQEQINLSNAKYDNDLKNIANSSLSDQQKAAQTIILTNQKAQAEKQLQKQQKEEDIKKATFDRDVALGEVAWNTARAIMKDTAGVPWPLSLEVGLADAALGAIQAAAILSRPIPKYAEGTKSHPGGFAIVGEGMYSEWVQTPTSGFLVNRPTLIDLPATTSVTPLKNNSIEDIAYNGMMNYNSKGETIKTDGFINAINKQTEVIKKVFSKSQTLSVRNTVIIDGREQDWINKKILGR